MFQKLFRKLTGTSRVGIEIRSGETSRTAFERMRSEYFGTDEWKELVSTDLETLQNGEGGEYFGLAEPLLSMSPTLRDVFVENGVPAMGILGQLFLERVYKIRIFLDAFDLVLSEESIATVTSIVASGLPKDDNQWNESGMPAALTSICIIENEFDLWELFNNLNDDGADLLNRHIAKVNNNGGKSVPYSTWGEQD